MKLLSATMLLVMIFMASVSSAVQDELKSRAERTGYTETSRYQDVLEFIHALQKRSGLVKVESFATTNEGRALPLVILSRPAIISPSEAASSGKAVVFIMANIHAGEVEGKEAAQHLMRDVATGPLASLLDKMILLVAPIYNADGNERIDIKNRSAQNGPAGGVGIRENAQRMDLNRDFMKLDTPEARGLIEGVFNRWDPHVIIDLHTTNGSYHGYALTFSPPLNPNADRRIISFARDGLLPEVSRGLKARHKYRTYFYGNFVDERNPRNELSGAGQTEPKAWATFDHRPRFGNNYAGLRNRIAILSEAYSYLDFRSRVDVTDKFVRAVLDYIARHAGEVVQLTRDADRKAAESGLTDGNEEGYGVRFELKPSSKPVEILVGSVKRTIDPRTNRPRLEATDEARPVKMTEYGEFRATRRIQPPAAYIIKPGHRKVIDALLNHGITVETLEKDESLNVEVYAVRQFSRQPRAFQGHQETRLTVEAAERQETFPKGSFIISMRQPKAALVFYLLEPESDDGLANWNYFDEAIEPAVKEGKTPDYPVYRLKSRPAAPRHILQPGKR
ncbi:MAG TPA: M14 family metallopeptidase [Blastocatellia bacterium]|nr:M14 family metallopeptidase [Blastocatellia bacterium]